MHFCTAKIAIGGDNRNIAIRDEFNPISWPEIEVLRLLHGDDALEDVVPFVRVNQPGKDERTRLAQIYGETPIQQCWGGRNAPSELEAPDVKLPAKVTWRNPLTGAIEGELLKPKPTPTNLAETVGDMTKLPAPIEAESDKYEETEEADEDDGGPVKIPPPHVAARKAPVKRTRPPVKKMAARRR